MTFSIFTKTFAQTQAPAAVKADIRRKALARLTERFNAGRADGELCFRDLVNELINAEAGNR